ncbi:hypothetical protein FK531_19365 [Rhodococcus spelaei]|uniref:DUF7144 domain-containing protein n=1 Tax=Rhodococcus spelaei TaxID=2546320 RepID=A0A541B158_9NOCA|nr:hypothetical protein [Rhodococcus spelaei]TQF66031.1 hypothetical protein FK531_19365 [Rhodococcus spelaei]
MTDHSVANHKDDSVKQGFAVGTSIAAAVLLLTVGILQIFQGISAVAKDNVLVFGPEYTYQFNITTWGWIHIVVGILIALTGFGLLSGATWARITAIFLAALSIIANFLWLPYYPLWSILIIALDVVVIWAVTTWDTDRV